jgi:hypothetical protein
MLQSLLQIFLLDGRIIEYHIWLLEAVHHVVITPTEKRASDNVSQQHWNDAFVNVQPDRDLWMSNEDRHGYEEHVGDLDTIQFQTLA